MVIRLRKKYLLLLWKGLYLRAFLYDTVAKAEFVLQEFYDGGYLVDRNGVIWSGRDVVFTQTKPSVVFLGVDYSFNVGSGPHVSFSLFQYSKGKVLILPMAEDGYAVYLYWGLGQSRWILLSEEPDIQSAFSAGTKIYNEFFTTKR